MDAARYLPQVVLDVDETLGYAGQVVAEALTNAAKHANASAILVDAEATDRVLHLRVRDDGVGGADPVRGSGLVGLRDRVAALGGTITVQSPAGAGTSLHVELPLADQSGAS